jgi:hypothetical protein
MKKPKKEKSPFRGHSIEAIMAVEATNYVIQVGEELFTYNGKMVFTHKTAVTFYHQILAGLMDMIKKGTRKEKKDALFCLHHCRVIPLRIQ